MRIIYLTANVLGTSGANAAGLFPKYSSSSKEIKLTIVADYNKNKNTITNQLSAEFLKLNRSKIRLLKIIFNAIRLARKAKQLDINIIHVFYRIENAVLVVFLRLFLFLFRAQAKILVDHRSVNLTRGKAAKLKKYMINFMMQLSCHRLAGNPFAVETSHKMLFRKHNIIDLGYDVLPLKKQKINDQESVVWFIGSLYPKNRNSSFLIELFDKLYLRNGKDGTLKIHVAGPANDQQQKSLNANPIVCYHGNVEKKALVKLINEHPGIGLAYMSTFYHNYAPALKFIEYAAFGYPIIASDTIGLRLQAKRTGYKHVTFVEENFVSWCEAIEKKVAVGFEGIQPWQDKPLWSYKHIFSQQCLPLYAELARFKDSSSGDEKLTETVL